MVFDQGYPFDMNSLIGGAYRGVACQFVNLKNNKGR